MILVIDLEASCDEGDKLPGDEMEMIEVGAVWATPDGRILAEFQALVRPVLHPRLTPFCSQLTGITQADVDGAPLFPEVAARLASFAELHGHEASPGAVGASTTPNSLPETPHGTASRTRWPASSTSTSSVSSPRPGGSKRWAWPVR